MRLSIAVAVLAALFLAGAPAQAVSLDLDSLSLGAALVVPTTDQPTQLQADVGIQLLSEGDRAKLGQVSLVGPGLKWLAENGRLDALFHSRDGRVLPDSTGDIAADLGASLRVYSIKGAVPMNLGAVYEGRVGLCWFIGSGSNLPAVSKLLGLSESATAQQEGWSWQVGPVGGMVMYTRPL